MYGIPNIVCIHTIYAVSFVDLFVYVVGEVKYPTVCGWTVCDAAGFQCPADTPLSLSFSGTENPCQPSKRYLLNTHTTRNPLRVFPVANNTTRCNTP